MVTIFQGIFQDKKDSFVVCNTFLYPQLVDPDRYNDERIVRILRKKIKPTTKYLLIPINLESYEH